MSDGGCLWTLPGLLSSTLLKNISELLILMFFFSILKETWYPKWFTSLNSYFYLFFVLIIFKAYQKLKSLQNKRQLLVKNYTHFFHSWSVNYPIINNSSSPNPFLIFTNHPLFHHHNHTNFPTTALKHFSIYFVSTCKNPTSTNFPPLIFLHLKELQLLFPSSTLCPVFLPTLSFIFIILVFLLNVKKFNVFTKLKKISITNP